MLRDLWLVLTGRLSQEQKGILLQGLQAANALCRDLQQDNFTLNRDLGLAQAAIADLKSKLPADWEAQQRAASDAIRDSVLEDITNNPEKYIATPSSPATKA